MTEAFAVGMIQVPAKMPVSKAQTGQQAHTGFGLVPLSQDKGWITP
jgi:hypothetical protein